MQISVFARILINAYWENFKLYTILLSQEAQPKGQYLCMLLVLFL